jgi:hypothetical protein
VPQVEAVIHSEANHRGGATSSAPAQSARIAS